MDDGPRIIHDASVVRGIVVTKDELQPPLENAAGGRPALNGDRCPRRQATKHGKVERQSESEPLERGGAPPPFGTSAAGEGSGLGVGDGVGVATAQLT